MYLLTNLRELAKGSLEDSDIKTIVSAEDCGGVRPGISRGRRGR